MQNLLNSLGGQHTELEITVYYVSILVSFVPSRHKAADTRVPRRAAPPETDETQPSSASAGWSHHLPSTQCPQMASNNSMGKTRDAITKGISDI